MTSPPDVQICFFTEAAETNSKYSNSMIREYQTELLSEANNINKHVLHSGNKVTLVTDNSNGCELFECMYKSERYLTAEEKKIRKIQIHGRFVSSGTPQSTTIGLSENGSEETSRFRSGPIQFQVSIWEFSCQLCPSGKEVDPKGVLEVKMFKLFLPTFINTMCIIGENGSRRSLLLSRLKEKGLAKEDDTLVLSSVRPAAKDDSNGSYYTYSHKPIKPSKEDIECMEKLARDPDKENKLCERFRNIAYGWEIGFRKTRKLRAYAALQRVSTKMIDLHLYILSVLTLRANKQWPFIDMNHFQTVFGKFSTSFCNLRI